MKLKLYALCLGFALLTSCSTFDEPVTPDFDVTVAKPTYKLGQEVKFNFSGAADMITFYSGQEGNDYNFREGRDIDVTGKDIFLEFQTAVSGGTQANQLSVWASTDFNGDYSDFANVRAATWTDITSRFVYGTNTTFRASTTKSIADLLKPGKPIFIAFKYVTQPQEVNGQVRQWQIQNFLVKSELTFNKVPVVFTDQRASGFRIIDEKVEHALARSSVTAGRVTLWGSLYNDPLDPKFDEDNPIYKKESPLYDPTAVHVDWFFNDFRNENWAVSKPIYTDKVNLGPDRSIGVKGMETQPKEFNFTYTKAGTYKAYFVATNANIEDSRQVIKSVDIVIEP